MPTPLIGGTLPTGGRGVAQRRATGVALVGRDCVGVSGGNVRQGVMVAGLNQPGVGRAIPLVGLTRGVDEQRDIDEAAGDAPARPAEQLDSQGVGVLVTPEALTVSWPAPRAGRSANHTICALAPHNVRMKRPRQGQPAGSSVPCVAVCVTSQPGAAALPAVVEAEVRLSATRAASTSAVAFERDSPEPIGR